MRVVYPTLWHIQPGYVSCNRCRVSASSGFKTGFRYCTMWLTKGGPFSLFLLRLSIARYVNCAPLHIGPFSPAMTRQKESVFIHRIWLARCVFTRSARKRRSEADSSIGGIMSHRAPLRSFASFEMLMRRKLKLERALGQWYFPRNWTTAFAVDHSDPVFRIALMDLELDRQS
jgi:hypothetical protein